MNQEIGNIGWFSLEESLQRIRPTNLEKRQILLQASHILKNTFPIIIHSSINASIDLQRNHIVRQDGGNTTYGFIEDESSKPLIGK
jgi:hypothetical protein